MTDAIFTPREPAATWTVASTPRHIAGSPDDLDTPAVRRRRECRYPRPGEAPPGGVVRPR